MCLEDIISCYSLYRDLIITGADGCVVANANSSRRDFVLGLDVSQEKWYQASLNIKDGTQYYSQDIYKSALEDQPSLIYSTAIREGNSSRGRTSGVMAVLFDFQGESKLILDEYMPKDKDGQIQEGCYSVFADSEGKTLSSTDVNIFPAGGYLHNPRKHRTLDPGESCSSYAVIKGVESALISSKTDGFLEYKGLGWSSHLIVPKSHIFEHEIEESEINLPRKDMMESALIPEINKKTYERIQEYKESIQLISLNGIVFASKLGKRGAALGPIFDRITKTGDYATTKMEELLIEMARDEFAQNAEALEIFSKHAIDLIERNLFERAADIRWWSTDLIFPVALEDPSPENCEQACERLKVINNSYTMYRNLVLCDTSGRIIATSRTESRGELKQLDVSNEEWFLAAMRTNSSAQYGVADVTHSFVERHKDNSLFYAGGVRKGGNRQGESIGVLGIMFDWDTEAKKILEACLQKDQKGSKIRGSQVFFTNKNHEIIESTDDDVFKLGTKLKFPDAHMKLEKGQVASGIFEWQGKRYLLGSAKTAGYRDYEGLGWSAHAIRPVDG